jgi:hypothetical protein
MATIMKKIRALLLRALGVIWRVLRGQDRSNEIENHLEMQISDHLSRRHEPVEARRRVIGHDSCHAISVITLTGHAFSFAAI